MKNFILLLIATLFLNGCGLTTLAVLDKAINKPEVEEEDWPTTALQYEGNAKLLIQRNNLPDMDNKYIIEFSLLNNNGTLEAYYSICNNQEDGSDALYRAQSYNAKDFFNKRKVMDGVIYPYTIIKNGVYYMAYNSGDGANNSNIYLAKSLDGFNWKIINNGKPIIFKSNDPNNIYYQLWNPAFTIDNNNVIHLYLECQEQGTNQDKTGLAYAYGKLENDCVTMICTDYKIIPDAACAWVGELSDGNLGILYAAKDASGWWVMKASKLINYTTVSPVDFKIFTPGVHICDPHVVKINEGSYMLSLSYDQKFTKFLYLNGAIEDLFR